MIRHDHKTMKLIAGRVPGSNGIDDDARDLRLAKGIGNRFEHCPRRDPSLKKLVRNYWQLLVTRMLSSLLFGVTATDPRTFALVFALVGAVALAACFVPGWRAARVDPLVALRHE